MVALPVGAEVTGVGMFGYSLMPLYAANGKAELYEIYTHPSRTDFFEKICTGGNRGHVYATSSYTHSSALIAF
jgi:hypothetical protein